MDRLQSMEVFVQVAAHRSFTRVADLMGMSQAMVSTHIAHLERRLGVRLLTRTTRSMKLTDHGARYHAHCQRVLSEIEEMESELSEERASIRGLLRVNVTVALASRVVVPVLPELFSRFPDIKVELHHTDQVIDLEHETYDVLICTGSVKDSGLVAKPISPMRMAIAASPKYLAARGVPKAPDDVLMHECIGYIDPVTRRNVDWTFERNEDRVSLQVPGRLSCNEGESRIAAAVAGLGLLLTPGYELTEQIRERKLSLVLRDWMHMTSKVSVAYPKNRYPSAKAKAFMDFMIEKYPPGLVLE